jgi:NADP-dependent 3-hydroxy acid dehydrogenase YdfG
VPVNNAGPPGPVRALDMPLDVVQTMLRVNVEGVFIVRRAILPHMITQGLGSVVNLASWAGKTGNAYFSRCRSAS